MSSTTPIMSAAELSDIQDYVARVNDYLNRSTACWIKISAEFTQAKTKLKAHAFERFVNDCGFTHAVAAKMIKIGRSAFIQDESNLEKLVTIEGWTVLYELSKIDDQSIKHLLATTANDNKSKLTREMISNFVSGKPANAKQLTVASVEFDEAKLSVITAEQFKSVKQHIDALKLELSKINVGAVVKSRAKTFKRISESAKANSSSVLVQTAA